jgi:rhomboid protease GluP
MSFLRRRRYPILTTVTLGLTTVVTATRLFDDGPLDALRRDPGGLGRGELWRLISPVLVQSDAELRNVVLVFVMCALIGAFAEQFLTRRRWLALYMCGALAGHAIGEVFQPLEGGTSVAFVGILGGLAAYALVGEIPELTRFKIQATVAVPLAVLDTLLGDIHGIPYLAGLAVGTAWLMRDGSARPPRLSRDGSARPLRLRNPAPRPQPGRPGRSRPQVDRNMIPAGGDAGSPTSRTPMTSSASPMRSASAPPRAGTPSPGSWAER